MYDCICSIVDTSSSAESPSDIDDRIAIDTVLDRLPTADRELLWLHFAYRRPAQYAGVWPPTVVDIAQYLHTRFGHKCLSRQGMYERIRCALRRARHVAAGRSFKAPRYVIVYQPHGSNGKLPRP